MRALHCVLYASLLALSLVGCQKDPPPENQPPEVNAGNAASIVLGPSTGDSISLNGSAADADGTVEAYQWTQVSGPGRAVILTPGSPSTYVTELVTGTYTFQLMATDDKGAVGVGKVTLNITQNNVHAGENRPPVVNAGRDTSITLTRSFSDSIRLAGTATDADGSVVTYMWTQVAGPANAVILTPGSAATYVTELVSGVYRFQLVAADNKGAVGVAAVSITIVQNNTEPGPNSAPSVSAGRDTTFNLTSATGDSIRLSGLATDPDGKVVSYQWSQVYGPNTAAIRNPGAAATAVSGLVTGQYQFQLVAADDDGAVGVSAVNITVVQNNPAPGPNLAPSVNAGRDTTFDLTHVTGDSIRLSGSAIDLDGMVMAYHWSQVSGPNTATIRNPGAAATAVSGVIAGVYQFQLMATDNKGATGVKTVAISVIRPQLVTLVIMQHIRENDLHIASNYTGDATDFNLAEIGAVAWTNGGSPTYQRGLLRFDLSGIPAGARIESARLTLYSNPAPANGNLRDANFGTGNAMLLQRVTANWGSTTRWFNQPATDATGQILIPHTTQTFLDLVDIDVTNLTRTMQTAGNFGFMLKLQNETYYNSRIFCSSKFADAAKHPKLVVQYTR